MKKGKGLVIGVVAQAGHGKDTCAAILREEFGFSRQAFADELKMDIHVAFSTFPECSIEAQNSRERVPWVRRLQQVYGTQWCRERLGEDYWVRRWEEAVERHFEDGSPGVVVPDVRFPNEMEMLRDRWDALIVFVERPRHREPGVDHSHESEKYVPGMKDRSDTVVINDGTLDLLRFRVVERMNELLVREGMFLDHNR